MKSRVFFPMMCLLLFTNTSALAQGFWQGVLQGISNGLNNANTMLQQQRQQQSNNAASTYQQSKRALENSSFSLQNTYARDPRKTINFNDGSVFNGVETDNGYSGTLRYADGSTCEGKFDFSWNKQGQCIIRYPGGNWYYGYFTDNREDGEGSIRDNGESYDVTFSNGTMISAVKVSKPKYDLDELDALKAYYAQEAIRQQQEYEINTNSSSYSTPSTSSNSRRKYSTSQINRQADVTTKAYQEYKKNPNSSSSQYYRSNQQRLNQMQGR